MNKGILAVSFSSIVLLGCGGGSDSSHQPTARSSCGEIHLKRGYSKTVSSSSFWSTTALRSGIYTEIYPEVTLGSVDTTLTSTDSKCKQTLDAYTGFTVHTWEGTAQGDLATGEQFYFRPYLRVQYDHPNIGSYQKWFDDASPTQSTANIKKVELYSVAAVGYGVSYQEFKPTSNSAMHLVELPLTCSTPLPNTLSITTTEKPVNDILAANIDTQFCSDPYNITTINGPDVARQCLSAAPTSEKSPVNCTFTNAKVGVPDNKGNYFPAYISGSVTRAQNQDFVFQINKVEY